LNLVSTVRSNYEYHFIPLHQGQVVESIDNSGSIELGQDWLFIDLEAGEESGAVKANCLSD